MKFKKGDYVIHVEEDDMYGIITEIDQKDHYPYSVEWYWSDTDLFFVTVKHSESALKFSKKYKRKKIIEDILK